MNGHLASCAVKRCAEKVAAQPVCGHAKGRNAHSCWCASSWSAPSKRIVQCAMPCGVPGTDSLTRSAESVMRRQMRRSTPTCWSHRRTSVAASSVLCCSGHCLRAVQTSASIPQRAALWQPRPSASASPLAALACHVRGIRRLEPVFSRQRRQRAGRECTAALRMRTDAAPAHGELGDDLVNPLLVARLRLAPAQLSEHAHLSAPFGSTPSECAQRTHEGLLRSPVHLGALEIIQ